MSSDGYLLVQVTCPPSKAENLARALVETGVTACVNVIPHVHSVYRWQGEVEKDTESLLFIKTTRGAYSALEQAVIRLHPYEVPEVIAVDIVGGSTAYLTWLKESVQ